MAITKVSRRFLHSAKRLHHSFDNPDVSKGQRVFGHWIEYDADATQRSVAEMHDFLAAQFAK